MTTDPFTEKLASQLRCPVCGGERTGFSTVAVGSLDNKLPMATFDCAASFVVSEDTITSFNACPSGSDLAAKLMTIEAEGKAERKDSAREDR